MDDHSIIQKVNFLVGKMLKENEHVFLKKLEEIEKKLDETNLRRIKEVRQSLSVQPFATPRAEAFIRDSSDHSNDRFGNIEGAIDGSNTLFTTAKPYRRGQLSVDWQGKTLYHGAGLTETSPENKQFTLDYPPRVVNSVAQILIASYLEA